MAKMILKKDKFGEINPINFGFSGMKNVTSIIQILNNHLYFCQNSIKHLM